MGVTARRNTVDSPVAEVGEIDTRAPFQSVKAAVSLFGEVTTRKQQNLKRIKSAVSEKAFPEEIQSHVPQVEANKLKKRLRNAEISKEQVSSEFLMAERTVEHLLQKIKTVKQSKGFTEKEVESLKNQLEDAKFRVIEKEINMKIELSSLEDQYFACIEQVDSMKMEIEKIERDYKASLEVKEEALQKVSEAERLIKANNEKVSALLEQINTVKTNQEQTSISVNGDRNQLLREKLEEVVRKIASLKEEFDKEDSKNLEVKLDKTTREISCLQMEKARLRALDQVRSVMADLCCAKLKLQKIEEEKRGLKSSVESMETELEFVRKEHFHLESAANKQIVISKDMAELDEVLQRELSMRFISDYLISTSRELSEESENTKNEARQMIEKAKTLKIESKKSQLALVEIEKNLRCVLEEAVEAKEAETKSLNLVKCLSGNTNSSPTHASVTNKRITISAKEHESLLRKIKEYKDSSEEHVASAMIQIEALKASENQVMEKIEDSMNSVKEIEERIFDALSQAEMADSAKIAVEKELTKFREKEQRISTQNSPGNLDEANLSLEKSSRNQVLGNSNSPGKIEGGKIPKMGRSSSAKKKLLTSFNGIFHKKRSQVEDETPPDLPGEDKREKTAQTRPPLFRRKRQPSVRWTWPPLRWRTVLQFSNGRMANQGLKTVAQQARNTQYS